MSVFCLDTKLIFCLSVDLSKPDLELHILKIYICNLSEDSDFSCIISKYLPEGRQMVVREWI